MVLYYELGNDDYCETYEYYVEQDDLKQAIVRIFAETFDLTEDKASEIIKELDLNIEELAKKFEEEVNAFFEDAAMEQYNDVADYRNFVKQSDFI